jgi:holo-[acyl-carrier protein] synthase
VGRDGRNKTVCAVGIDLVEISEIEESIAQFGERYLRRVYTSRELGSPGRAATSRELAGVFALKEAALKALAPADEAIDWRWIEVRGGSDTPQIALSGVCAELAAARGILRLAGTVAIDRRHATAVVLAERSL